MDEKIGLVRAAPAEDVGEAARGVARHAAPWLVYEPFRDIVTHPSEPLPAPTAQRSSVGPPPRCKADLIDAVGRSEIQAWFDSMLAWMLSLVSPDGPKVARPPVLVIG